MNTDDLKAEHRKHISANNQEWAEILELRKSVRQDFKNCGCLSISTFDSVIDWKLRKQRKRTEKHRTGNTEELIRELTGVFLRVKHANADKLLDIQLAILQAIPGVGIGVASAIMTLSNPKCFAIIDFRNWKVIYGENKKYFTAAQYKRYLTDMRRLAKNLKCDVQEIDYILWKKYETI
jgi:thermostable 8-oxoguanine DNA glycosylase